MGGCRCTYRNCTVKSDGQIHLFHYPVFDKLRCHQWLMNAHRLDFFDLRVSQLKNRVVCQYHFKDDHFMNFKKDKLKFYAIPTEDGPYCNSSEWSSLPADINKMCPIIPEDIENTSIIPYDKKTNYYSLRYGDFLTNTEPADLSDLDTNKINTANLYGTSLKINLCNNALQDSNKSETHSSLNSQLTIKSNKRIPARGGRSPRVKIISEKKIRDPIPMKGRFRKVPPSVTLPPPKRKSRSIFTDEVPEKVENIKGNATDTTLLNNINLNKSYVVQVEFDPSLATKNPLELGKTSLAVEQSSSEQYPLNDLNITQDDKSLQLTFFTPDAEVKEIPTTPQPKQLIHKAKLTPERKAAIDSKREFNKMLRNVIHACLDTKDSGESKTASLDNNKIEEIKKQLCLELKDPKKENEINSMQKTTRTKPVRQINSILKPEKKPNIPLKTNDSFFGFLEARMQILESNVMNKIDQNTKQISELKQQFAKGPSKDFSTQTYENEESYKKFLYKEISKFLSPSCNSLIYEELFINKYSIKDETAQPRAKRRR